jgi:probable HAF family extracellular repeat protein
MKSKVWHHLSIIAAVSVVLSASAGMAQNQEPKKQPPHYTVVNLGTPLGGSFAIGMSINFLGWVGGYANLTGDTSQHAALWLNSSRAIDLGTLGGPNSALYGTYSGFAETSNTDPLGQDFCAYGDFLICVPFVLKFDSMVPLPTLGGDNAVAYTNNQLGQTVGVSQTSTLDPSCLVDGQPQPPFYSVQHALPAIWENDRVKTLPLLPGDVDGQADGVNDLGQVVGYSGYCLNPSIHALLWKNDKVINLGSLGGVTGSAAASINNLGEVTGNSDLSGDATYHAFLWRNGVMTDLGTLPGDSFSYGNAINDRGQIVGESCDVNFNCRPFLWENDVMSDLNTLIPTNSNLYLLYAANINDFGEIVGYAYDATANSLPAFLAVVSHDRTVKEVSAAQPSASANVTLPDNVRAVIQQQLRRGRFGLRLTQPQ